MPQINNFPIQFSIPNIGFKGVQQTYTATPLFKSNDTYISNPLVRTQETREDIEALARTNPRIMEILRQNNIPLRVNEKALNELNSGHLLNTRILAAKIYSALPDAQKSEVNLRDLQEAAMFHDYGKVLIPEKVLNKNDALTDNEWEVMKLHSELGAELLKNKGLSRHSLELIKYHHQRADGSGYPALDERYEYGIDSQILTAADKYTALTEKRAYKEPLSKDEALSMIANDVGEGIISEEVYDALVRAIST